MKNLVALLLVLLTHGVWAQVGIDTTTPDPSASLEVAGTTTGVLINRVALTSAAVAAPVISPARGLLVFNTATDFSDTDFLNHVRPGFYHWNGSRWISERCENRSARFGNSAANPQNLNGAGIVEANMFGFTEWNDDNALYSTITDNAKGEYRVVVAEAGRYEVNVNVNLEAVLPATGTVRRRVAADLIVDDGAGNLSFPATETSNTYLRLTASNNDGGQSTITITDTIELAAGSELYVSSRGIATDKGIVRMNTNAGSCLLTIKKIR